MKALGISNDKVAELLQSNSRPVYIDRMPVQGTTISDIDLDLYYKFLYRKLGKQFEDLDLAKSLRILVY